MKEKVASGFCSGLRNILQVSPDSEVASIHSMKCSSVIGCSTVLIFTELPSIIGMCFSLPSCSWVFSSFRFIGCPQQTRESAPSCSISIMFPQMSHFHIWFFVVMIVYVLLGFKIFRYA